MKHTKKLILSLLLLSSLQVVAQDPDTVKARVYYTFTHVEDTTKRDEPRVENMVLLLGQNASLYTSGDKITLNLDRMRQVEEQQKNATPGADIHFVIKSIQMRYNPIDLYQYTSSQKMIINQILGGNYLVEVPMPVINWKIGKDTLQISGLHCIKAEGNFRGRDYTAWFCPDLPFQSGPWKLNGLPGLIVEAHDAANEVIFKLNGLELIKGYDKQKEAALTEIDKRNPLKYITISLPKNGIKATADEFNKLVKARNADPAGVAKTAMNGSGLTFSATQTANPAAKKFQLNNPIERGQEAEKK